MKHNLYCNKMFIADLLIVSLWALFVWHFAWGSFIVPILIGLRVALCFMLLHRSRWTFFSAALFSLIYFGLAFNACCDVIVFGPIVRIAHVSCCLFGYSEWAMQYFDFGNRIPEALPVLAFWGLYTLWLTVVPLVCSWNFKSVLPIFRHRRRILWYVCAVIALSIFINFMGRDTAFIAGCSFMSFTPLVFRCVYSKGKPALLQYLLQDRALMIYVSVATVLFSAILIGLYNVTAAKAFASVLFPIILYVFALRTCHVKAVKTVPALLLGIAGFLDFSGI